VNVTCHLRTARHSIRALQTVEKGEELVARSIATGRAIQWCCPSNGRERDVIRDVTLHSGSFRSIRTEGTNYAESVWEFRSEIRGEP